MAGGPILVLNTAAIAAAKVCTVPRHRVRALVAGVHDRQRFPVARARVPTGRHVEATGNTQ